MNNKFFQKIHAVNGQLQATIIQEQLEKAGVPVNITHSNSADYLDVLVPEEFIFDANYLLHPEINVMELSALIGL
jgi:ABC-type transport system substrate-binding protein